MSWSVWVSARPLRVPPSYPGIRGGPAQCGSQSGRRSRRLSRCARSGPHPRRCWRWWRSWSAWGLRGTERVPCPEPPWAGGLGSVPRDRPPPPSPAQGLPMLHSSSSEPSPQSSSMLQRSEEDRQRWFWHRNSFLSLQWGVWAVGGSGEGGVFRSGYSPPHRLLPQGRPAAGCQASEDAG